MPAKDKQTGLQQTSDSQDGKWQVYIVQCADKTLYTGVARDVSKRVAEHNTSIRGAKYTKARRPVKLVYAEPCDNQSQAQQREHAIKKLSRMEKLQLIQQQG